MKLGISCGALVAAYGYEKALELCRESGFDAVDFSLICYGDRNRTDYLYDAPDEEFEEYFTSVRSKADMLGIEISQTHGRLLTYIPDEKWCSYTRQICKKDMIATRLLGAPSCVIHSILSKYWVEHHRDSDFMHKKNKEFFDDITPFAEENGVNFALETFGGNRIGDEVKAEFFGDARELKKQFDMLETKNKTICVDTGHTNNTVKYGLPGPEEAIRLLGHDVTLLHLHDNTGNNDTHLPPLVNAGDKAVHWSNVFDALDEIGYQGVYNFELNLTRYGNAMPDAVRFLGKWLRSFVEGKGR